jgi:leucyl-tRNA synthetase
MVCHETYRDANGQWLFPSQVEKGPDGALATVDGHRPVSAGRSEKMSKSKRNVVDPENIIATYGADTARWFMLSDSPPERDLEWTEAGVDGAWRFTQRLWRLLETLLPRLPAAEAPMPALDERATALRRAAHKTIAAVTEDIETFRFNRAVAHLYEFSNAVDGAGRDGAAPDGGIAWAFREALEVLARLANPMMPHLTEEMWAHLGHGVLLAETPWPEADAALVVDAAVTVAVQVNGKLRATLALPRDLDAELAKAAALADPAVQRVLDGKPPRKIVVVPNRIVNLVV